MADTLTIGAYAFVGGNFHVTNFAHGIASPADYAVAEWESNPSPRAWPFVTMHDNADRAVVGYVSCTTESLARQELALIAASCTVGSSLTWQPDGQASAVSCTVLAVDIDIPAFDPVTRRIAVASGHIDVTVSIRTTPYWLGP